MWSNPRIPFRLSSDQPRLEPLKGKPLMVHLAMSVEYWPFDKPMPRGIVPAPHGAQPAPPDVPNFGWVEYGVRAGAPRLMRMLRARGLPVSVVANAQVADIYPALMEAVVDAGWELVGHGFYQRSLKTVEDEGEEIRSSLARLEQVSGKRPRSWLGCGLGETFETPDILKAEGVEFLHDWAVDDLPVWMRTRYGPLLALPYTFDLNDVPMYLVQGSTGDEIYKRVEATLATYDEELADQCRVLTLSVHPHIVGAPHVAHHFGRALDLLMSRDDVVFVTSSVMGDWFIQADGTHGAEMDALRDGPPA
jgi:peptidoglycan/xylan/chitin deacetylase (PgdA/CDA1 family)